MKNLLRVSIGQYSHKGRKEINQDFHDLFIPKNHLLTTKGIGVAIADGISSSKVSQEASKIAVVNFLQDYYATPESWSVENAASKIITSINSWLFSKNKQNLYHLEKDKGYVCTFSSVIIKSSIAHIFHVGDTRVYLIRDGKFKQLTTDHRTWISKEQSYLTRALGIDSKILIDYENLSVEENDIFMLATDGVYEFVSDEFINTTIEKYQYDLDTVAKITIDKAYENNSDDNLTVQFLKVDNIPNKDIKEIYTHIEQRPIPPILEENQEFDGYIIIRELSHTNRSHVYLAVDRQSDQKVVIKIPSTEFKDDESYLESFLLEEWIAKRIKNPHVLKAYDSARKSNYFYLATEYIEGETLAQWMIDNPKPSLDKVREFTEQIIKALNSFHKLEMVYQDLRPQNIMIDKDGTLKLIDFGAVFIKGINEIATSTEQPHIKGTATYSAPEYFVGEAGSKKSDLFSLAVIVYEMLSKKLPYGVKVARTRTKAQQKKLQYTSIYPSYPVWIDECLRKALSVNPNKRYEELSEFLFDLKKPNKKFLVKKEDSIIEREPLLISRIMNLVQFLIIIYLLKELGV